MTPIDLKINEIVNYFDVKTSNNVIVNDNNCDFVEKVVNHKLLPHSAKCVLISVKYNKSDLNYGI